MERNARQVDGYITGSDPHVTEMYAWARDRHRDHFDIIAQVAMGHSPKTAINLGADRVLLPVVVDKVRKASLVIEQALKNLSPPNDC